MVHAYLPGLGAAAGTSVADSASISRDADAGIASQADGVAATSRGAFVQPRDIRTVESGELPLAQSGALRAMPMLLLVQGPAGPTAALPLHGFVGPHQLCWLSSSGLLWTEVYHPLLPSGQVFRDQLFQLQVGPFFEVLPGLYTYNLVPSPVPFAMEHIIPVLGVVQLDQAGQVLDNIQTHHLQREETVSASEESRTSRDNDSQLDIPEHDPQEVDDPRETTSAQSMDHSSGDNLELESTEEVSISWMMESRVSSPSPSVGSC
ncbi:hypothetical protein HYH03_004645 [Edaphochlamys debaryana]|uniref:Uncharacterized protein n=1 Tax=Edaphochlamys debaryana TaxID=47281 RepID=A0A835Y7I6_9CHLO|nr:hypothetical protein HYH03_004645 [Edaphochlamys debaryana]|eukprot:KAG2497493.1 hypothetical protein HYH03_004645 [Edaphochlamys debaryana]